jgi:hypothetical protein
VPPYSGGKVEGALKAGDLGEPDRSADGLRTQGRQPDRSPVPSGGPQLPERNSAAGDVDPAEHHRPLGAAFRPGCHDPQGLFETKERAIAERLAEEGSSVHPRRRDDTVFRKTNPDAMVRAASGDPGTITEFKTLDQPGSNVVRRNILKAGGQLAPYGGGDAVIDGRAVGLTAEDTRRGYARAVGQAAATSQPIPTKVHAILSDGSIITLPEA